MAGSQSGASGGRVGNTAIGGIISGVGGVGEVGKRKMTEPPFPFSTCHIIFGGVDLVQAHAVANEIEHILGLLSPSRCCTHNAQRA